MKYNNVLELIGNTPIIKIDDDITKLKHIEICGIIKNNFRLRRK